MIRTIRHYSLVTIETLKLAILTMLEYPANIIGWLLSNPIQFLLGFATIKFVVSEFGTINGWDYNQLAFLYGISVITHALSMIFFVQGWFMGYFVIEGEFDRYMLRPISVLYQFFFTNFNLIGVTDLIPGICVFTYGCIKVNFQWTPGNILGVIALIIGATLIRGGIYLIMGTTTFWTRSTNDFAGFTQELFDKTTMYPLSMYPEVFQNILTFLIPIGWVSFYPASQLLGIPNGKFTAQGSLVWVTFGIGILVFCIAGLFFKFGLRNYESAGH